MIPHPARYMMPTLSRLAADALVILHLAFILFVIFGGWLAPRWPRLIWLHLPAVVWGVLVEWTGWICTLTPLENNLLFAAGEASYTGGFIDRYLLPLIYPTGLTREAQLLLGAGVVAPNILVYGFVLIRWVRRRRLRNVSAGPGDRSPCHANGCGRGSGRNPATSTRIRGWLIQINTSGICHDQSGFQ